MGFIDNISSFFNLNTNGEQFDMATLQTAREKKIQKLGYITLNLIREGKLKETALKAAYEDIIKVESVISQAKEIIEEIDNEDISYMVPGSATNAAYVDNEENSPKKRGRKPRNSNIGSDTTTGTQNKAGAKISTTYKKRGRKPKNANDSISAADSASQDDKTSVNKINARAKAPAVNNIPRTAGRRKSRNKAKNDSTVPTQD